MLNESINRWQMSKVDGLLFQQVNERLDNLASVLYQNYEPMTGPFPEFWVRFERWVENVISESDQKLLFRLAAELFFVGTKELDNLYRIAFNAHVSHWLIDQLDLKLDDPDLEKSVSQALERTWFCPVSDSMRINAFYHLNHLSGRDYRPDWHSLAKFGDRLTLDQFLKSEIDRIVLLEDFVGTGAQIEPAIKFLGNLPFRPPTLLVPLIICPGGIAAATEWSKENTDLTVSPVIRLREHDFLSDTPAPNERAVLADYRSLIVTTYNQVLGGADPKETKTYTPFGFRRTGSLVVLATNCPDNTLPLVHHKSGTWNPLFPRASRI